jgi:(E)-4-hydroxy-3-methylbut-2-enyl-diphosphate synthase
MLLAYLPEDEKKSSRVQASRRLFEYLESNNLNFPVIHHLKFPSKIERDDLVIKAGSEAGALLVDGLGDGILLEAEDQDFEFLRTTSFGMLQGCRMRNTKTVGSRSLLCTLFRDSCSNVKSHVHNSTLEL